MTIPPLDLRTKAPKRLHCLECGRTVDHSAAELLEFTRLGWPKCCNEVMELVQVTEELPIVFGAGSDSPGDRT